MNAIDRLNRHPVVFTIFLIGAIASIVSLFIYLWSDGDTSISTVDSSDKEWGIIKEYAAGGDDIVEGWLTTDTLTWGATIPLPPFGSPPEIDFWRNNGAGIKKPAVVEKTADQFSISINSSEQAGKWMWRARGAKKSANESKEKMTGVKSKGKYLIQSYNSLDLYDSDLTITLSSTVQYFNSRISLTISTKGGKSKTYNEIAVGEKVIHENYEITFIETQKNVSAYDVWLRVLKTNQT